MAPALNSTVLLSDASQFHVEELNPYSHRVDQPDVPQAEAEHRRLRETLTSLGVDVRQVAGPSGCQDGVYVANWALCHDGRAVLSRLPNLRRAEEPYARRVLEDLGLETIEVPGGWRFSGQGDALFCGALLFAGSGYRTDPAVHAFLAATLDVEVVSLETLPALDAEGRPIVNRTTGWPDSLFYDLDLALAVIRPDLIAWCPDAFTPESRDRVVALPVGRIEVSVREAVDAHACNLVSTGEVVVLNPEAKRLRADLETAGLATIGVAMPEIAKGGGFIRCTTLTLDHR